MIPDDTDDRQVLVRVSCFAINVRIRCAPIGVVTESCIVTRNESGSVTRNLSKRPSRPVTRNWFPPQDQFPRLTTDEGTTGEVDCWIPVGQMKMRLDKCYERRIRVDTTRSESSEVITTDRPAANIHAYTRAKTIS